jgi:hypothetical protein
VRIVIDHVRGSRRGQRQEFGHVTRLSIGRHPDNDISFDAHRDLDASSRHAELRREGRGFVLHDVGSSNGTLLGGQRITQVSIAPGAPILVEFGAGGPVLQIWAGQTDDEPPAPPVIYVPHAPTEMWDAAIEAAHTRTGIRRPFAFARTLAGEVVYRSSWRFRIVLLLVVALAVAGLAALLAWRGSAGPG